ncbi:MAG: ArsR/SmtB family transcription factor [Phycisphaeraceae bacterium]
MQEFIAITKALADESRARAVAALAQGELCLCQIVEVLGLSPSTVSKHMSILHQAGLVERRKDGRWHYYRLAGLDAPAVVREALAWALRSLENEKAVVTDAETLCCVREKDRQESAACYSGK